MTIEETPLLNLEDRWVIPQTIEEARGRVEALVVKVESIQDQLGEDTRNEYVKGHEWRHRANVALRMSLSELRYLKQWQQEYLYPGSSKPRVPNSESRKWLGRVLNRAVNVLQCLQDQGVDIGEDGRAVIEDVRSSPSGA